MIIDYLSKIDQEDEEPADFKWLLPTEHRELQGAALLVKSSALTLLT
jgi:hypothetical protein